MRKHKRFIAVFILSVLSVTLMSSCGTGGNMKQVVIAGSTSVQPFIQGLSEEYAELFPDIKVNVQGGGSSAGVKAAEEGVADIGMSSRSLRDEELEKGMVPTVIARDGLALIVHPNNPVTGITTEQARGIYSGEITNWNEIGGKDAKIHVISREAGSGTREVFEKAIMTFSTGEVDEDGDDIKEVVAISNKAMIQSTNGTIKQLVSGDEYSIGFISLGLICECDEKCKDVCDSPEGKVRGLYLDGTAPTVDNVNNESYGFYRPFIFVTHPDYPLSQAALEFKEYVLDPERGQKTLAGEGLVPNPIDTEGAGE
jgi:phosphate transport system substrate-binding protein